MHFVLASTGPPARKQIANLGKTSTGSKQIFLSPFSSLFVFRFFPLPPPPDKVPPSKTPSGMQHIVESWTKTKSKTQLYLCPNIIMMKCLFCNVVTKKIYIVLFSCSSAGGRTHFFFSFYNFRLKCFRRVDIVLCWTEKIRLSHLFTNPDSAGCCCNCLLLFFCLFQRYSLSLSLSVSWPCCYCCFWHSASNNNKKQRAEIATKTWP